jgi:colanic acid biosynthesis protein WcaH
MSGPQGIDAVKRTMRESAIEPELGLGEELFLFASTLMPVVNVDLVVMNDRDQVLLAWRNDPYYGKGWHIPGGCVRFRETLEAQIQMTAVRELGANVVSRAEPFKVFEVLMDCGDPNLSGQKERAHFITLAFLCELPGDYRVNNAGRRKGDAGFLKWFDALPDDLLRVQDFYRGSLSTLLRDNKTTKEQP